MGWVINVTSRPLYLRERPGTHCIRVWVGLRAGLDVYGKSRPPPPTGLDPRTVQPVSSRYTDYAIPALYIYIYVYITKVYTSYICAEVNAIIPYVWTPV